MIALILLWAVALTSACVEHDLGIRRVVDGDTLVVEAPWLPAPLGDTLSLRILGLDTPECRASLTWGSLAPTKTAKCEQEHERGQAAAAFTLELVSQHAKDKHRVVVCSWDKYGGRILLHGAMVSVPCHQGTWYGTVRRGGSNYPSHYWRLGTLCPTLDVGFGMTGASTQLQAV